VTPHFCVDYSTVFFNGRTAMADEQEYRRLAAEARSKALQGIGPYDKRTFLLVAQRYDVLADRARRIAKAARRFNKSA
jgi:hypothetical protein